MVPAIQIENLSKRYAVKIKSAVSTLVVLKGIDLNVRTSEFLALLGPSGCGKSTLLQIIDGLVPADGKIFVDGMPVTGPGFDRGMVFQDYALFPWRTVIDNVTFGLEMKREPKKARMDRAREYLSLVGLSGFEHMFPSQLSGGMKQRVALARALACNPDVLLMDEPFAALDAQTREILQEELLKIWEMTGKTILFVTHSIEEAVFLAQRVVVITARPGKIKAIVDVPFPPSRYAEKDLRSTVRFTAIRHALWELLRDEVIQTERRGGEICLGHEKAEEHQLRSTEREEHVYEKRY